MRRLWARLKNNFGLKAASIFFAILLWSYVVTETDPLRTRTFSAIPVEIVGINSLEQNELALRGDASNQFGDVRVTVQVNISELSDLDESRITVTADVSQYTEEGQYAIELYAHSPIGEVLRVTPQVVTVVVEERKSVELPIEFVFSGSLTEGLYAAEPLVNPKTISVIGAASDIASIEKAAISINLSSVTSYFSKQMPIELINDNGDVISKRFFSEEPKADVTMAIYPTKTIPIDSKVEILDMAAIPEGYAVATIEVSPNTMEIAGTQAVLDGITNLKVEALQVRGLMGELWELKSAIVLPENTVATKGKEVTVRIRLQRIPE